MKHLTDETFEEAAAKAPAVLIDFTAAWCPPCHAMKPVLEQIDRPDLQIVEVDVEESPGLTARFGVRAMPTFVLLQRGRVLGQLVGAQPRARLDAWLSSLLTARA